MTTRFVSPPRPPRAVGAHPIVRVVAPSGSLAGHADALEAGVRRLEAAGARVRLDEGRARAQSRGDLAGPDEVRLTELLDALTEPDVDIVWAARGGSGLGRLGPALLSASALRDAPPKIVVGFSDITTLLEHLTSHLRWTTFHGPVITSLGRPESIAFDHDAALAHLRGELHEVTLSAPSSVTLEGRLRGGNLTVLASLVGTPLAPRPLTPAPELWVLEDVSEAPYRLDRAWTQLLSSGALDSAVAVWLGDLDLEPSVTESVAERLREDLGRPVLTGAPAGHRGTLSLLPMGARVRLTEGEAALSLLEPVVDGGVA